MLFTVHNLTVAQYRNFFILLYQRYLVEYWSFHILQCLHLHMLWTFLSGNYNWKLKYKQYENKANANNQQISVRHKPPCNYPKDDFLPLVM